MKEHIIAWWSGGITSAVACKLAIDLFGKDRVRIIFIDTRNEDDDTYRFKKDCEAWYGLPIETISSYYKDIRDVWRKFVGLNFAHGAICSTELKRAVREAWEAVNKDKFIYQTHGFDMGETERALAMALNYPDSKPIFPLLLYGITKDKASEIVTAVGIELPRPYREGYRNNNCYKTGCVRGGIGYWQKRKREFPEATDEMGDIEHELTAAKGKPVTMLRIRRGGKRYPLFIKKNPAYPDILCIDEVEGRPVKPLNDCNGYCGINDLLKKSETEDRNIFLSDILKNGLGIHGDKSLALTASYGGAVIWNSLERRQRTMVAEPVVLYQRPRGYNKGGFTVTEKSPPITVSSWQNNVYIVTDGIVSIQNKNGVKPYKISIPDGEYLIRKFTPEECELLQGLPAGYTEMVPKTHRYKGLGNGWNVDTIEHILSYINDDLLL